MPVVFSDPILNPPARPYPLGAGSYNGIGWGPGQQLRVVKHKGLEETPTVVANDQKKAQRHGSWPGTDSLDPRTVGITFVVLGVDNTDLRTQLALIERAWVPGDSIDRALWLYDSTRSLSARCRHRFFDAPLGGREKVSNVEVEWWAADPIYKGAGQSVAVGPALGVGGVVPVTNLGVFDAPVVIQVLGPAASPFTITNQTAGATIQVNVALGAADVLEIGTDLAYVKVNGAFADTALDAGLSRWWNLKPGVNQIAANRPASVLYSPGWP